MTRTDQASPVEPGTTVKGAGHERGKSQGLYTAEERVRRDESVWTIVQGVLAPLQFLVFLVSLGLVLRTLTTGEGAIMQADPKAEADQCARLAEWPHCVPQR